MYICSKCNSKLILTKVEFSDMDFSASDQFQMKLKYYHVCLNNIDMIGLDSIINPTDSLVSRHIKELAANRLISKTQQLYIE